MKEIYLNDIKSFHIEEWIIKLSKSSISNTTINQYISILKVILNEAFRRGDITVNPIITIKSLVADSIEKRVLTQE